MKTKRYRLKLIISDWKMALIIALPIFGLAMWYGIEHRYSDMGLYAIAMALGSWQVAEMAALGFRRLREYRKRESHEPSARYKANT